MPSAFPSLDAVFELLSGRRRRYVLYYLAVTDGRKTVRIDLHHNHLPRLVENDARTETVRNWNRPAIFEWVRGEPQERRWLRALFGVDERSEEP